ncbi:uncharacterized protein LOC128213503 [Mya arenaria]|uniref:uncharacterized protein LOC128213503 n=1 Tax=Mya arenaria TaxID=6604 RepID=UPI0022E6F5E1|nr:uncharacterized protein LOC128213503 [Mya arenaria]
MLLTHCLALLCALVGTGAAAATTDAPHTAAEATQLLHQLQNELHTFKDHVKNTVKGLARQTMLQQLFVEERIRSDGASGIKQLRGIEGGTRPYHSTSFTNRAAMNIHEHANYDRTPGIGEFIGVLNGVEFRTRHNDYKLRMPSTTTKNYEATEDIPFPDVPPSVLNKHNISEAVAEMRAYFKAFHDQDLSLRDYRPYFKPVMCYLEGAWTTDTKTITEPFQSDRHFLDASSWFDLQEKVRFTSASGGKSQFENFSYLPTTVINVTDDGEPVYAQWNYRILCHPIKTPLSLQDFKPVDDLAVRMYNNIDMTKYAKNRAARFTFTPDASFGFNKELGSGSFTDEHFLNGKLDDIMYEIPGKDNYPGHIEDRAFNVLKYRADMQNNTVLNTARYHRHFRTLQHDDSGNGNKNLGFSDPFLFVAETTNPRVAKMGATDCHNDAHGRQTCQTYEGRYTYAVPMEVIWMTPLSTWNPYNLYLSTKAGNPNQHGRNGGMTSAKAFNGTSKTYYYLTPTEFYTGGDLQRDPADTARDGVGVLDQQGHVRHMAASGVRIFTPNIQGVGSVRLRYPVFPVHQEGNAIWKNLMALQDITMNQRAWQNMFEQAPESHTEDTHYVMRTTFNDPPGNHFHEVFLTTADMEVIAKNGNVTVMSTLDLNHQHELVIRKKQDRGDFLWLDILTCDGLAHCWDGHDSQVHLFWN